VSHPQQKKILPKYEIGLFPLAPPQPRVVEKHFIILGLCKTRRAGERDRKASQRQSHKNSDIHLMGLEEFHFLSFMWRHIFI